MQLALAAACVAALFLWSCSLPAEARDRALIIGVNSYPDIVNGDLHGVANLRGAVTDAQSFSNALVDTFKFDPSDIKLLTDEAASHDAILAAMQDWLIAGSGPGDRVVFYFSGHGATARVTEKNGAKRLTSTIVPSDVALNEGDSSSQATNMIEGRTIGAYLRRLQGRRVTVFADSCHSGSVTRGLEAASQKRDPSLVVRTLTPRIPLGMVEEDLKPEVQTDLKTEDNFLGRDLRMSSESLDLAVWSAAAINQVTFDGPDGGVFTQGFLAGLRELKAANGNVANILPGQLLAYVQRKSADFCAHAGDACQALTPNLQPAAAYRNLTLAPSDAPISSTSADGAAAASDAIGLLSHHNDFPISVDILPGETVRLHDHVTFKITSEQAGTLVVLDAGPDGKLRQIFPNAYADGKNRDGLIRADAPTTIPDADYGFAFEATDVGRGRLLVLVADRKLDLSGVLGKSIDSEPIADPRGIAIELAQKVETPMVTPDLAIPNGAYKWAFKAVPYEITPR